MADALVWLVENGDYWKAVWKKPDGSRGSRSLGARRNVSRRQATVLCREIEAELRATARIVDAPPRLSEWLTKYGDSRTDVGEATKSTYRECGVYLRFHFDDDPTIDRIDRAAAADWHAELASGRLTNRLNERGRTDPNWENPAGRAWRVPKPATVAKHVRAAKLMFQAAADQDRILINPFDRLNGTPPKPLRKWRDVTADDMARILDACPDAGWRALFALCRWAGLRRGEALTLEWADVDWAGNRMRVNEHIAAETTKRRKRVVPIEPRQCPSGLTRVLLDAREAAVAGARLVCASVSGNNVRRTALNILKRSGVGAYAKPFHTLRACCETDWAQHYPQHVVSEWIGHDITVSQDHYLRVPEALYAGLDTILDTARPENSGNPTGKAAGKI